MTSTTATQKVKRPVAPRVDLQHIADFFKLGKIKVYSKSAFGRTNSTYFVTTQDNIVYAFRVLCELDVPLLENERYIQHQLLSKAVNTSEMLTSTRGEYFYAEDHLYATVSKKLAGHPMDLPTSLEQSRLMGETLSKFHLALTDCRLPCEEIETSLDRKKIEERISSLPFGNYKEALTKLMQNSPFEVQDYDHLPTGLIHGDLHVGNVLMDEDRIYVLDLQSVKRNLFVLDIGRSVADVCSSAGKLEREKLNAYLEGYQKNRRLTAEEGHLLNKAITYGAVTASVSLFGQGDYKFAQHFLSVGQNAETMLKN